MTEALYPITQALQGGTAQDGLLEVPGSKGTHSLTCTLSDHSGSGRGVSVCGVPCRRHDPALRKMIGSWEVTSTIQHNTTQSEQPAVKVDMSNYSAVSVMCACIPVVSPEQNTHGTVA